MQVVYDNSGVRDYAHRVADKVRQAVRLECDVHQVRHREWADYIERTDSKGRVLYVLGVGDADERRRTVTQSFLRKCIRGVSETASGVPVDEAREKILAVIKKRAQVNSADDFAAALA